MATSKPSLVIATGFEEDNRFSVALIAKQMFRYLVEESELREYVNFSLFVPTTGGRKPTVIDRRIRYPQLLPKADVLHLLDPAYADSLLRRSKDYHTIVLALLDLAFWHHRTRWNSFIRKRIYQGIFKAHTYTTISKSTAEEIKAVTGIEVESIVYPGVDPVGFAHSDSERDLNMLLHVGTTMHRKGLDRVFRFLAMLPKSFHFVQVGGKFTDFQLALLRELKLEGRVRQLSFLPDEEVRKYYSKAAALIFPSRYEGFGMPCVEARMIGTRVIMSPSSPSIEILDKDAGTLCTDFSCFDENGDNEQRREIIDRFLKFNGQSLRLENRDWYSWGRVGEQSAQLYEKLLQLRLSVLRTG